MAGLDQARPGHPRIAAAKSGLRPLGAAGQSLQRRFLIFPRHQWRFARYAPLSEAQTCLPSVALDVSWLEPRLARCEGRSSEIDEARPNFSSEGVFFDLDVRRCPLLGAVSPAQTVPPAPRGFFCPVRKLAELKLQL